MNEDLVEQAAIGWLESLGFATYTGATLSPGGAEPIRSSHDEVVLVEHLRAALRSLNEGMPEAAIEQAVRHVSQPPHPTLELNNQWFHRLLTDGVDVEYRTEAGEQRGGKVWLLDFDDPSKNQYAAVRQLTVKQGSHLRRLDLVAFVNGLPLVVFEFKDPTGHNADVWDAYQQLQEYKRVIPSLFAYNELLVVSDGLLTRVGSLSAGPDRFAPWRSLTTRGSDSAQQLEVFIRELMSPDRLLPYLRYCVVFEEVEGTVGLVKKVGGYHQFRALISAANAVKVALRPLGDGRGGLVWHTQGSGKSLTMLMLAGALVTDRALANPTIVVVTDRNDLDGQLFRTFLGGRSLLRQIPEQAESRADLVERLGRASGGIVFTTIQKFESGSGPVSSRDNVVVLADEAHRSQYGFVQGGARWMRDALPNATFVGFTGTPLERDDRSTRAVFGADIDVYDIRQALEDRATVPIFYEMQLVKLVPDDAAVREAEQLLTAAEAANSVGTSVARDVAVPLEDLVGSKDRLRQIAEQIVQHFEGRREAIEGKAMVVTMSRNICMDLHDEIVALRPQWYSSDDRDGAVKVVMTGTAAEGERIARHARSKARRDVLAARFKDPTDDLRLVIVCDMWLTGFDCPPLHTMYLDKPLAGHNLMQAIARVNRVFGEKPGGVVVDFLGIADELRDAVQTYTLAGGTGRPIETIQADAVPVMQGYFESLQDFFSGVEYTDFFGGMPDEQLAAVARGADHTLSLPDGKTRLVMMVASLAKAFALVVPRQEALAVRDHLGYFQAVSAAIRKSLSDGPPPPPDTRAAVRQIVSGAVMSGGVIDLFEAAGLPSHGVEILSDDFLQKLSAMPQKNLALEALRKLLNDEIRIRERVNLVQARTFRESLSAVLVNYNNRAITTAQVIDELVAIAKLLRDAIREGTESGLTEEELAFYDALADNESAKQVLQDDALRSIARELATRIRSKASIDWTSRDAVRADMRRTVRRLLAKYGYPPDAQESATGLVIRQAELLAEQSLRAQR